MKITVFHLLLFSSFLFCVAAGFFGLMKQRQKSVELKQKDEAQRLELDRRVHEQEALAIKSPEPLPSAALTAPNVPSPIDNLTKSQAPVVSYTVRSGDTLWRIAKMPQHFGQGHRWYDVWKANEEEVFDFDELHTGQVIIIPIDKPDAHPWPKTASARRNKILSAGHFRATPSLLMHSKEFSGHSPSPETRNLSGTASEPNTIESPTN